MHFWAHGICGLLNIRVTVEGSPPEPPFFLVCNHLSYLDIVVLNRFLRCTFVAKKEMRTWPVLGKMAETVGVIFIDRGRRSDVARVNRKLVHAINEHQGVVLFPEGTSSGGTEVLPFYASLLALPAAKRFPVHVATIRYETGRGDKPAIDSVCFFGKRDSFTAHVWKLAQTKHVYCSLVFAGQPVKHTDRKVLALQLREIMQGQLMNVPFATPVAEHAGHKS